MSIPKEMQISFQHLGTDYNLHLVRDKESEHSVEINGISYAVSGGDKEKLDMACKILKSVSLEALTSEEDLKGRLSFKKEMPSSEKTDEIGVETLKIKTITAKDEALGEAYKTLKKDLKDYASKNLKEGALLVQVVGIKGAEKGLVFGKRSVNDTVPILVNENTIGRTGSGAKLWAGLLTNVLTSKYSGYIQMEDGLGKFAPKEALRKFGRIGSDGKDVVDPELAKTISMEGLIGMMAGLEYEQATPKDPPQSTLDQFMRGHEIKDGSIHMLFNPRDKINFYTNNISLIAYPIEKAYKKVLAAELIEKGQVNPKQSLRELSPLLEPSRKLLQKEIDTAEGDKLKYLKEDLEKLTVPDEALDLTLQDLMDCEGAYINSSYTYDLIDLFLMPSNNHRVDYAEIMKRELLQPLGMEHSGFHDVPGIHMDVTFENDTTKKDESYSPPQDHPMRYGAGFGRTCLADASKMALALSNPKGLVGKDGKTLLTNQELDHFFAPHGHYEGWGLGGAELTCGGKVIDKGGSLNQDQYSFWIDRKNGVGMIAMCNCGRRPDEILNAFKEKVEHINYPDIKPRKKELEGAPLGISRDHFFEHPLKLSDVRQVFEGSRGRIALLFDDEKDTKGFIHWSGTPLELEKQKDGSFQILTPGRFEGLPIRKIKGEASGENYLILGDTSFKEIDASLLPSQKDIADVEKEFINFRGQYMNDVHPEWGVFEFEIIDDKKGNILLGAREGEKWDFAPQSIVKVEPNSILFNGHDRQPPDKMFRFTRDKANDPWHLEVLDYASQQFIEKRFKS